MNWFSNLYQKFVPRVQYSTINGQRVKMEIDGFTFGKKIFTHYSDSYHKYVELQRNNFVLNTVIGKIAKGVSSVKFVSEKSNDAILAKLKNPNDKQSQQEFLKEFTTYLKSAGWAIIWKDWQSIGNLKTLQLKNIDPDCCDFDKSGTKLIFEYEDEEHTVLASDCIVFYDTVKLKDGRGYSRIKPLRSQVTNIESSQIAKGIQIENSGTTIVSPKGNNNPNGVDEGINGIVHPDVPGQITQKQQIENNLTSRGLENRIIVASKGLDAVNLSAQLNSFDFSSKVESDVLAIYDAFGVPQELSPYGKSGNSTQANKEIATLELMESEVMPIIESLLNSLKSEFPNQGDPIADVSHLSYMSTVKQTIQATNKNTIQQTITLYDKGWITEAEAKKKLKENNII